MCTKNLIGQRVHIYEGTSVDLLLKYKVDRPTRKGVLLSVRAVWALFDKTGKVTDEAAADLPDDHEMCDVLRGIFPSHTKNFGLQVGIYTYKLDDGSVVELYQIDHIFLPEDPKLREYFIICQHGVIGPDFNYKGKR